MIRVMLADDQALVRQGIESLLSLSEEVEVVAEAANGEQVLQQIAGVQPDVLLLDIRMPVMDGIATLQALNAMRSTVPVLMLTTFDDHNTILAALQAGAKGYLLKDVSLDTLVAGIQTLAAGDTLFQPALSQTLVESLRHQSTGADTAPVVEPVSAKEREVLRLMAAGLSNNDIATATCKSVGTVKNQVSAILAKLAVRDRTRAVLKAIELGLLD
ncbi:response regulator transcription factor [Alteromonas sp. ASW11-19]|uniref:Response regulator transcription factor n=1 Tax=Alteromonas salexigens TaxID=2982530 RepID=A0ABT2VS79_9ALTE|nr:response regulator transcription factor [Alteromonas salexigens]MCU7555283.1 response regulator transcription factor [Alteromonas salexigens]